MAQAQSQVPATELSQTRLLVFDTHPIQYRSPVFQILHQKLPQMKVAYFADKFDGNRWWFREVGKIPKQNWGIDLQNGFPNEVLERKYRGPIGFAEAASSLIRKTAPNAILIFGYYLPEHWILWWLGQYYQIPVLFIGETSLSAGGGKSAPKLILQNLFFRGVSQFVSIGHQSNAFYRSFSIDEERITAGKYCVDTDFFQLQKEERKKLRSDIREQWGIPEDAFVMLFVGRMFDRKRPLDVLEIHKQLLERTHFYTLIVGNGPDEELVKAEAQKYPRVVLAGFRNQKEMRSYYAASDLLIVPSEFETWGLVVNEAFCAELPAVVTQTCGCAHDLVLNGETGFVYPKGNVGMAARLVGKLIDNPKELKKLAEDAKKRVVSLYRVDQFADAIASAAMIAAGRRDGFSD